MEIALFLCVVSIAFAAGQLELGGNGGGQFGGKSVSNRHQDHSGNYEFSYDIVDHKGHKNGRKESGSPLGSHSNQKHGSYYINIDGKSRLVNYIADDQGFRAQIHSNEPGITEHLGANIALNGGNPILSIGDAEDNGVEEIDDNQLPLRVDDIDD